MLTSIHETHSPVPPPTPTRTNSTLTKLIPSGLPTQEHFEIVTTDMSNKKCEKDEDLLLSVICMSADPYLRSGCKTGEIPRPMSGFVVGKIIESKNKAWPVGSFMGAALPFSSLQLLNSEILAKTISWNLTEYVTEETATLGLGVLGMPGATAYGGFIDVLRPKKGETIFVSSAAGAVGSMVGQLAKNIYDCHVIGSCGGAEKNKLIKEKFGFDGAIDYKAVTGGAEELAKKIKESSAAGIDMYFENVGGMHFEAAMACLKAHGRVAICGCISRYNDASGAAPLNKIDISQMIYSFQRIEGFVCMPWLGGAKGAFLKEMSAWHKQGKVGCEQCIFEGIETWPDAFQSLFTGANLGKVCIKM